MAMKCEMDMGETRIIQIGIHSIHDDLFNILSAEYEMSEKYTGNIVGSGQADIEKHILRAMVTPPEPGTYLLKYIYQIGMETFVEVVEVKVK